MGDGVCWSHLPPHLSELHASLKKIGWIATKTDGARHTNTGCFANGAGAEGLCRWETCAAEPGVPGTERARARATGDVREYKFLIPNLPS